MKPVITTQGKLAQLRYELPHRVHDAHVYPVRAPNGSTIVLYAYESGVAVLWRGGRPLKSAASPPKQPAKPPAKVNGTSNDAVMIIDSDDENEPPAKPTAPPKAEYEDEEEELDPDQPYPSIIQHLRLSLNTEVLHIAIPHIPAISALRPASSVPAIFSNKIVFTVACADYSIRIITLPLEPPSDSAKQAPLSPQSQYGEEVFRIPSHSGHKSIPLGISMTWTSRAEPVFDEQSGDEMEVDEAASSLKASDKWDLLVASHSREVGGLLNIWRLNLSDTSVTAKSPVSAYQTLTLRTPATKVAFSCAPYPKRRHSQLLITDKAGVARIYDPFALPSRKRKAGSDPEPGAYVALFKSPFQASQNSITPPILAARKSIIDAVWASDGNSILALLADGQWGIWDVTRMGPSPPTDPSEFSVQGFLGRRRDESQTSGAPSPRKLRGDGSSLAPMTPNTRKYKEAKLFKGTSSGASNPPHGGITIASLPAATGGTPEDSAIIWYGADVYRIPNVAQFWSRSASGGDKVTLSRPSISAIEGISLLGESITSIDQFDTTIKDARMARPRDALISTDHRLIFLTQVAAPLTRALDPNVAEQTDEEEDVRRADQALLARGELDLGGMDRLLEDMEGSGSLSQSLALGNPRRVLFASSRS
jgi:hypothetical protein